MIDSLIADAWLATVLNDVTLLVAAPGGLHADVAPEGTASPWVVWFQVSSQDASALGPNRIMTELVYEVRVTGRDCGYSALKTAANRVDTLLQGIKNQTLTDGAMMGCERVEIIRFSEQDGETVYRHLGGQYKITVKG